MAERQQRLRGARGLRTLLDRALDAALAVQRPAVAAHVERVRRRSPDATPAQVVASLERQYLATVTAAGAAVGGAAAAPGVGTGAAIALSAGETAGFLEASALFTLAVAEVHGERVLDVERRRTLLLAVLVGERGPRIVQRIAGRTGQHWGTLVTEAIPLSGIRRINRVLGASFVTRYSGRQGIIVLGRAVPFGIGAGIGAAGNAVIARSVIAGTRRAFGPAPVRFAGDGRPVRRVPSERLDRP